MLECLHTRFGHRSRMMSTALLTLVSLFGSILYGTATAHSQQPSAFDNTPEGKCLRENYLEAWKWKGHVMAVFRRYETQHWDAINDYEAARRDYEKSMQTFLGLDSTGKSALYTAEIAQLIKVISNTLTDALGILTGGQGTAVGVISGVAEGVATGLRDGKSLSEVTKPVAGRAALSALGGVEQKTGAALMGLNASLNLYDTLTLRHDWRSGVKEAEKAHERFDAMIDKAKQELRRTEKYIDETEEFYQAIREGIREYCRKKFRDTEQAGTDSGDTVDCTGLSTAKCRLKKLRAKQRKKSKSQWDEIRASTEDDADRLRQESETAASRYRADADKIFAEMMEATRKSVSSTLKEITERNRQVYRSGPSANCAESVRKIAAYDEWLREARRSRTSGASSRIDAEVAHVQRNRNAERNGGLARGCKYP